MEVHRAALSAFAGHSRGAVVYEALWSKIRQRIDARGDV